MGLENLLKYIESIKLLLPLILTIVTMVEGLFSKLGASQGAAKKEAAVEIGQAVLADAGLDLPDSMVSAMIDSVVKIKNQTGEFTHGLSQAPPDLGQGRPAK